MKVHPNYSQIVEELRSINEQLASSAGGLVQLSSGTFTSPVSSVDIALPSGYSSYKLFLSEFQVDESGEDSLNARFSFDGGVTFANGNSDYFSNEMWSHKPAGSFVVDGSYGASNTLYLANGYPSEDGSGNSGYALFGEFSIYPGSNTLYPTVHGANFTVVADGGVFVNQSMTGIYKGQKARATHFQLLTTNGSEDIARGTWMLFGIRTP